MPLTEDKAADLNDGFCCFTS